jgi:hypothetical protein
MHCTQRAQEWSDKAPDKKGISESLLGWHVGALNRKMIPVMLWRLEPQMVNFEQS